MGIIEGADYGTIGKAGILAHDLRRRINENLTTLHPRRRFRRMCCDQKAREMPLLTTCGVSKISSKADHDVSFSVQRPWPSIKASLRLGSA